MSKHDRVHPSQREGPHQFLFSTMHKADVIVQGFQSVSEHFRENFSVHMMVTKLVILFTYTVIKEGPQSALLSN